MVLTAGPAAADERRCTGKIGAVTVDDLVVPAGKTCTLVGTRVEGNIKIERKPVPWWRATSSPRATRSVTLVRSTVGGSAQLKSGVAAHLDSNSVKGDKLFSNKGKSLVVKNKVDGNLQCKSSKPAPIGSANKVKGNKEDQCRRL